MPRQNQTQIKLDFQEVVCLLDALEGQHLDHLSELEIETRDRLLKRLDRALGRI